VSATEDCRKLIKGFKKSGIDAVMVDLRGNGGGLLNEAISLSGLFIDEGPVVQVRDASACGTSTTTRKGLRGKGRWSC